jgi:DNA ligase-1
MKEELIEEEEEHKEDAAEEDVEMENAEVAPANEDELAEIDGVKPKRYLPDGEEIEAKSMTR